MEHLFTSPTSTTINAPGGSTAVLVMKDCVETLWRCGNARDVVLALVRFEQALHQQQQDHLYHDKEEEEDESEAFLAIQGAVLRFCRASPHTDNNNSNNNNTESVDDQVEHLVQGEQNENLMEPCTEGEGDYNVQIQALKTAAALAETRIGPAWWRQRRQRLARNTTSPGVATGREQQQQARTRPRNTTHTSNDFWMLLGVGSDDKPGGQNWSVATDPEHVWQQQYSRYQPHHRTSVPIEVTILPPPPPPQNGGGGDDHSGSSGSVVSGCSSSVATTLYSQSDQQLLLLRRQQQQQQHLRLYIPEVVPAAMIRFALGIQEACFHLTKNEAVDDNATVLVVAREQIKLVLALCCCGDINLAQDWNPRVTPTTSAATAQCQWSIPGIEGSVSAMVVSWLDTLKGSHDNAASWKYTVVSACQELLAAGLWLVPTTAAFTVIDSMLLAILDICNDHDGINQSCQSIDDGRIDNDSVPLHAQSAVIAAVSAITIAASRSMIPEASIEPVVRAFCRLHVAVEKSSMTMTTSVGKMMLPQEHLLNTSAVKVHYDTHMLDDYGMFDDGQVSTTNSSGPLCGDIRYALLSLLSKKSSESAAQSLVLVISACLDPHHCQGESGGESCTTNSRAAFALSVLSYWLWKGEDAHNIRSLPALRVYWRPTLECIRRILSSSHLKIVSQLSTAYDERVVDFEELTRLAAHAIMCLRLVVEKENTSDGGSLSHLEWDTLSACLVEWVLPWLSQLSSFREQLPVTTLLSSSQSLVVELSKTLQKQAESDTFCYLERGRQNNLYFSLLRYAVPFLEMKESRALGCAVIICLSKSMHLALHDSADECDTLNDLLHELFRQSSSQDSYVHTPFIRLQGIKILSTWEKCHRGVVCSFTQPKVKNTNEGELVKSAEHLVSHGLSVITKFHEFIERKLLPLLRCLLFTHSDHKTCCSALNEKDEVSIAGEQSAWIDDIDEIGDVMRKVVKVSGKCEYCEFDLSVVSFVGDLCRNNHVSDGHRAIAASMLRSVMLNRTTSDARNGMHAEEPIKAPLAFLSKIAAVAEFAQCLASTFGSQRCGQNSAFLVESLCAVVDEFIATPPLKDSKGQEIMMLVYAFDALSRLRLTEDNHVGFFQAHFENETIDNLVQKLFRSFSTYPSCSLVKHSSFTLNVLPSLESEKVFEPVFKSAVGFLCMSMKSETRYSRIVVQSLSFLRKVCFCMLDSLSTLTTVWDRTFNERPSLIAAFEFKGRDDAELAARNSALRKFVQRSFFLARGHLSTQLFHSAPLRKEAFDNSRLLLGLHLRRLCCASENERMEACSLLPSLLPIINRVHQYEPESQLLDDLFFAVQKLFQLTRESLFTALASPASARSISFVLDVLHDLIFSDMEFELPMDLLLCSFHLCDEIISKAPEFGESCICHLAFRCLPPLIDFICETGGLMSSLSCSTSDANLMSKIITDLVLQGQRASKAGITWKKSKHEDIATETENIERFRSDGENDNSYVASWLYGEGVLLTCRVGAVGSRFNGWTETILRTATARHRALHRIPLTVSLELPDFPSSMWISQSDTVAKSAEERCDKSVPVKMRTRIEALSSRFHSMMQDNIEDDLPSCTPRSGSPVLDDSKLQGETITKTMDEHGNLLKGYFAHHDVAWLHFMFPKDERVAETIQNNMHSLVQSFGIDATPRRIAGPTLGRAISVLDRTTEMNTHKIALLFDSLPISRQTDQSIETRLLASTSFSSAFQVFAEGLGKVTSTRQLNYFSAGLDTRCCDDGDITVVWIDEDPKKKSASTSMVVFHVASLMPTSHMNRKRHIGNDNVIILYSDEPDTLKHIMPGETVIRPVVGGAFGFVTIFVTSPSPEIRRVSLRIRHGLPHKLTASLDRMVCDREIHRDDAPVFVRCLAMRADLACRAIVDTVEPPSLCLERYQLLLEMRRFVTDQTISQQPQNDNSV